MRTHCGSWRPAPPGSWLTRLVCPLEAGHGPPHRSHDGWTWWSDGQAQPPAHTLVQPPPPGGASDVVYPDGGHWYWSTHCRHATDEDPGGHDACKATELAPGVPRRPAQCKTCGAPCRCYCHKETT